MILIVNELDSKALYQDVTSDKNKILAAIRPHLYIHATPSGSLKLQILDTNNELIVESEEIVISDITAADYYHGYVRFYVNLYMQKDVTYRIKLVGVGYTYDPNVYVGWCNDWGLNKYDLGYTPSNNSTRPLDMELWSRTP